jgi:hypothetical protein
VARELELARGLLVDAGHAGAGVDDGEARRRGSFRVAQLYPHERAPRGVEQAAERVDAGLRPRQSCSSSAHAVWTAMSGASTRR